MIRYESDSLDLGKWLETLRPQRKLVKKESGGRKVPFLPQPMGRPAVEASLAPPRAAEREDFFGKFQSHGFNSGDLQKKWPDRDSDPCPRATGPKKPTARL